MNSIKSAKQYLRIARPRFIWNRILRSRKRKATQAQRTAIAFSTGDIFRSVARPGLFERCVETNRLPNDLALVHTNDRRHDANVRVWLCAEIDRLFERVEERT